MKNKNLFSKRQYGFISGRSTQLQLLEVLEKWTEAFDEWKMKELTYMMIWFGVCKYRSGMVNSKSFIAKVLLRIKWKFELIYAL